MPAIGVAESVVEVRVPALPTLVPTVRAMAADLASRADYDLDAIADLRMAVDEACARLIALSTGDDRLICEFTISASRVEVSITLSPGVHGRGVDTTGFGWRVLETLVDEASTQVNGGVRPAPVGIRLVKKAHTG
jgi:serine/threonine-protein kinase RsbW